MPHFTYHNGTKINQLLKWQKHSVRLPIRKGLRVKNSFSDGSRSKPGRRIFEKIHDFLAHKLREYQ